VLDEIGNRKLISQLPEKRSGVLSAIKILPSKGFFLNQCWSIFNRRKKARKKHRKSFDRPVDPVLKIEILAQLPEFFRKIPSKKFYEAVSNPGDLKACPIGSRDFPAAPA